MSLILVNSNEVIILFKNGKEVSIYNSEGKALDLYFWLHTKTHLSFEEFTSAIKEEDTCVTNLKIAC